MNHYKSIIKQLKKDFGKPCDMSDLDDFSETYRNGKLSELIANRSRCYTCRIWEAIRTLEDLVELVEWTGDEAVHNPPQKKKR